MSENAPFIKADRLVKHYGSLAAVDGVSFAVEAGEIFGLLGPNGAGKTTTLEMLEGLRTPDSGDAVVLGQSVIRHSRSIKGADRRSTPGDCLAAEDDRQRGHRSLRRLLPATPADRGSPHGV